LKCCRLNRDELGTYTAARGDESSRDDINLRTFALELPYPTHVGRQKIIRCSVASTTTTTWPLPELTAELELLSLIAN
jgi:hypothetical protein